MSATPDAEAPRPSREIEDLVRLMARLRDPERGCPWDLAQSFATVAPYTVEEAYEVADAVERGDLHDLCDELGDLLLQVVFHARLAEEQAAFAFGDVVLAITSKLIRRHPHVFGEARSLSPDGVKRLWDEIKRAERTEKLARRAAGPSAPESALDGVPLALPALGRADRLARKAAAIGFKWPEPSDVLDKVEEEIGELREALATPAASGIAEEYGDVLFTVANLGHYLGLGPEEALSAANRKFERRFRAVEARLAPTGGAARDRSLAALDRAWDEVKREEAGGLSPGPPPPGSA